MDAVGVDGAIFISAFSMYRYDASYAVEVQRTHPGRFALVKPVDPDDRAVADVIADWKKTPGTVGIRIMMTKEAGREPNDPGLDRILRAAVRHDFPVNMLCWGNVDALRRQKSVAEQGLAGVPLAINAEGPGLSRRHGSACPCSWYGRGRGRRWVATR